MMPTSMRLIDLMRESIWARFTLAAYRSRRSNPQLIGSREHWGLEPQRCHVRSRRAIPIRWFYVLLSRNGVFYCENIGEV